MQRSTCYVQVVDARTRQLDRDVVDAVPQRLCYALHTQSARDQEGQNLKIREVGDRLARHRVKQVEVHSCGIASGEIAVLLEEFETVWLCSLRGENRIGLRRDSEAMVDGGGIHAKSPALSAPARAAPTAPT